MAQEVKKSDVEEVLVTGTRIQRNTESYEAVNSTTTVTAEEMKTVGATTVDEMIMQMPTNIGTITPETIGDSPGGMGGTIANLRGMNTPSGTRTLTLVDGKRYVPTNEGGAVDMSVIPSALVSRMDTVTGGASASYGSDAIAGVVNVILDKEFDGVRLDTSWGQTSEGDGEKWKGSFVAGTGLWDDKAHVTFAYEHSYQASINECSSRDYCADSRGLFTNGLTPPGAFPYSDRTNNGATALPFPGQPQILVGEGFRFGGNGVGQVFRARPTALPPGLDPAVYALDPGGFWEFNEAGTALRQIYADLSPAQIQAVRDAGGATGLTQFGRGPLAYFHVPLIAGSERDSATLYFSYLFDNDIKTSATVSYAQTSSNAQQNSQRQMGWVSNVWADNPYLAQLSARDQAIIRSRMGNCNTTRPYATTDTAPCLPLDKVWTDQLPRNNTNDSDVLNVSLDAMGPIGDRFTWNASVNFGRTERLQEIADWATRTRWEMANDSVNDGGVIKCRINASGAVGANRRNLWIGYYQRLLGDNATVAEATQYVDTLREGCQPVNPFGYAASKDAMAYSWPTYPMETTQTMQSATASVSGELWEGWAGPLQAAVGLDYDSNKSESTINTNRMRATDILVAFGGEWSGRTTNFAPFAEVELPLLSNLPGAKSLMLNGAYRWTQNKAERLGDEPVSSSRDIESWKASLVYQPIDSVRLRATYSEDVRAPAARELFRETAGTIGGVFSASNTVQNPWVVADDPTTPENEKSDVYLSSNGGNTLLKPEVSTTKTLGLVFTPTGMFQGLSASVDYYETEIKGGIQSVTAANVLSGCYQHMTFGVDNNFCDNMRFGTPVIAGNLQSNIESIETSNVNAETFTSKGIDYQISYFRPFANSSLNLRLLATQFVEQDVLINALLGRRDVAGQTGMNGIDSFFGCTTCAYTPTPKWQGNLFTTYATHGLASTLQVRYVGAGDLSKQAGWISAGETGYYINQSTGQKVYVPTNSRSTLTVNDPDVPAWITYNLHFNYSFADSPWSAKLGGLEVDARVINIANKVPEHYTGRGAGGINAVYYSGLGRQYEVGMRYKF